MQITFISLMARLAIPSVIAAQKCLEKIVLHVLDRFIFLQRAAAIQKKKAKTQRAEPRNCFEITLTAYC